jgi:hypothetical protein
MTVFRKTEKLVKNIFWKQLLGKYKSPELDPDPDLAVKIPDPAERSGFDRIPDPDPQYCFMHSLHSS